MPEELFRLRLIILFTVIISIGILIRIVYISSLNADEYKILEENQFTTRRGDILDRKGSLLAVSDELESVYANPKEIKSIDKTAYILSQIFNEPKSEIIKKLKKKTNFVWIKRLINPKEADYIKSLNLSGISFRKEYKRLYPNKNLASHILGFCNIDSKGVEGIEKTMDSLLIGTNQKNIQNDTTQQKGSSIILTIDSNIQAIADKIIEKNMKEQGAEAGTLVFADGLSGEILCIANYPNFDPNFYNDYNQKLFRNFAVFNQFEPGSIMKIFSLSALLDLNRIGKSDRFYCDGAYRNGNITVKCTGIHGTIDYNDIIKYSCNAGMLEAAENINASELYYYLKMFGFGSRTNLNLPGEQEGILRTPGNWNYRSMFSIPIGQEISVNSMQIIRGSTAFINDGIMIDPYIIKGYINADNSLKMNKRKEIRRVLRPGISQKILYAMKTCTDPHGTVRSLNLEGVEFAAKSGTGQIYDNNIKSYSEKDFTASLLVIFPYSSPRYIIYVVFHKPKGKIWGGIIGSKVINEFLYDLTGYMNFKSKTPYTISYNDVRINAQYKKIEKLPADMPNLVGLDAGDIINIFSNVNIDIRIYGNGRVNRQEPDSGELLHEKSTIKLYLE